MTQFILPEKYQNGKTDVFLNALLSSINDVWDDKDRTLYVLDMDLDRIYLGDTPDAQRDSYTVRMWHASDLFIRWDVRWTLFQTVDNHGEPVLDEYLTKIMHDGRYKVSKL